MPTVEGQIKKERLDALRAFRRVERTADTSIEKLERRIYRMLESKRAITIESAKTLVPLYNDFWAKAQNMQNALTDLLILISQF